MRARPSRAGLAQNGIHATEAGDGMASSRARPSPDAASSRLLSSTDCGRRNEHRIHPRLADAPAPT